MKETGVPTLSFDFCRATSIPILWQRVVMARRRAFNVATGSAKGRLGSATPFFLFRPSSSSTFTSSDDDVGDNDDDDDEFPWLLFLPLVELRLDSGVRFSSFDFGGPLSVDENIMNN